MGIAAGNGDSRMENAWSQGAGIRLLWNRSKRASERQERSVRCGPRAKAEGAGSDGFQWGDDRLQRIHADWFAKGRSDSRRGEGLDACWNQEVAARRFRRIDAEGNRQQLQIARDACLGEQPKPCHWNVQLFHCRSWLVGKGDAHGPTLEIDQARRDEYGEQVSQDGCLRTHLQASRTGP